MIYISKNLEIYNIKYITFNFYNIFFTHLFAFGIFNYCNLTVKLRSGWLGYADADACNVHQDWRDNSWSYD